jgi:hypothetical protein
MMYQGTLIDDLMATVERAERHAHQQTGSAELEHWYALAGRQLAPADQNLLGVA